MITGYISGQELRLSAPALAAGSIKYLEAEFHFAGHDWDGYAKTAYFLNGDSKIALTLVDDRITSGMGLNLTEGEWEVKLTGVKGGSRITTTTQRIYVRGFGSTDGELPNVTATLAEQLQGQIGSLSDLKTGDRASLVSAINELGTEIDGKQPKGDYLTADTLQAATDAALAQAKASGEFDGAPGAKGDKGDKGDTGAAGAAGAAGAPGKDGTDGVNGITPTIGDNGNWYLGTTDTGKPSRGAAGDKGADGHTPEKGVDYWTAADKSEIVQDTLAALPAWTGGDY